MKNVLNILRSNFIIYYLLSSRHNLCEGIYKITKKKKAVKQNKNIRNINSVLCEEFFSRSGI